MVNSVWVMQAIFFLGFFHGLQGDHLISILNSKAAEDIYERPGWVSFKLGVRHLVYALGFIIPLWLLRIGVPLFSRLPSRLLLGGFFGALGVYSFYEFFWAAPKRLHQHDHHHQHNHSHLHQVASSGPEREKDIDHSHFPQGIDKPESATSKHKHAHDHHHEHLHFHDPQQAGMNHHHQHCPGVIKPLGTIQNLLSLLAVSMTALVFPLPLLLLSLVMFLVGLFISTYLLGILYRGKGIDLMSKIDHFSSFFLGLTGGLVGFWLLW